LYTIYNNFVLAAKKGEAKVVHPLYLAYAEWLHLSDLHRFNSKGASALFFTPLHHLYAKATYAKTK